MPRCGAAASTRRCRDLHDLFILSVTNTPTCEWLSASGSLSDCRGAIKCATEETPLTRSPISCCGFGKTKFNFSGRLKSQTSCTSN